jgi:hypothetical protein
MGLLGAGQEGVCASANAEMRLQPLKEGFFGSFLGSVHIFCNLIILADALLLRVIPDKNPHFLQFL